MPPLTRLYWQSNDGGLTSFVFRLRGRQWRQDGPIFYTIQRIGSSPFVGSLSRGAARSPNTVAQ